MTVALLYCIAARCGVLLVAGRHLQYFAACCRDFNPANAEDGSVISSFGQLFKKTMVSLSSSQQYLLLLQADNNGPETTALYTIRNSGTGTAGLPGVSLHCQATPVFGLPTTLSLTLA